MAGFNINADELHEWRRIKALQILKDVNSAESVKINIDDFTQDWAKTCTAAQQKIKLSAKRPGILKKQKKRIRYEKRIQKNIAELIEFLENDDMLQAVAMRAQSKGINFQPDNFMKILQMMNQTLLIFQKNGHQFKTPPKGVTWLIEEGLPELYEKHFGKKLTFSRPPSGGDPCGPGIRFITSCLKSLGITKSAHAIGKMIQRRRKKSN